MRIIDGRRIAKETLDRLAAMPKPAGFLAAVLVGGDKSSVSFLAQKERIAKQLGVDFRIYRFSADIKNDDLREEVGKIAKHKTCGGVIVQLPLPEPLNWYYILNAIPPEKDPDVLSERSLGAFYVGRSRILSPSVATVEAVARDAGKDIGASCVAIVGLGLLVGRPVANWIMRRAKETFLLRNGSDLALLKHADIIVSGVGKAGLVTPEMVKEGALVIDFGYGDGKGDFYASGREDGLPGDAMDVQYTPTPGGTGPVLVAKLFENFYALNAD
jgi:methylenetetrahydrofolate dehydrogenase (NADP+)/methenyltetrahydrofolate cyclohydrolase